METTFRPVRRQAMLGIWLSAALVLVIVPSTTQAAGKSFTVNSTTDEVDKNPGDGRCLTASGKCSLRAAIQEANAQPPGSTITVGAGKYVLTIPGAGEDASATGDLDITKSMTINGAGTNKTIIDGNGPNGPNGITDRVLHVLSTATVVNISKLTIQNGSLVGADGGGILNQGALLTLTEVTVANNSNLNGSCGNGGGIENLGTLNLVESVVTGNGAFCDGGGIVNVGKMTLQNVTVSNNGTSQGDGGGIFNSGSAKLTNVTVSGNSGFSIGGGIRSDGSMTLTNVTISGNSVFAGGCGGIVGSALTTLTNVTVAQNVAFLNAGICVGGAVTNTIIANNLDGAGNSANCGAINSLGHNLSSDGTCGLSGPGDLNNTNPLLGPLANNGGVTLTQALPHNSPAIDAGTNTGCPSTDQRGIARPQAGTTGGRAICDIGAYEYKLPSLVSTTFVAG